MISSAKFVQAMLGGVLPRAARAKPCGPSNSSSYSFEQLHNTRSYTVSSDNNRRRSWGVGMGVRKGVGVGHNDSPASLVASTMAVSASLVLACACDACLSCCTAAASSSSSSPSARPPAASSSSASSPVVHQRELRWHGTCDRAS